MSNTPNNFSSQPSSEGWVVLEVGRPISNDVSKQFNINLNSSNVKILSIQRAVSEQEIPSIVSKAYHLIRELSSNYNIVNIVLSGPLALAFELGQAVGLSHFRVRLYQFSGGRYVLVPPLTREHLFQSP